MLPPPPPGLLDGATLFLDFDGTLVDFAPRHDAIVVPDRLKALLPRLEQSLGGGLAIVTGRPADEIVHYLGLDPARPGLAIAGSHAVEMIWPDGRRESPAAPDTLDRAVAALQTFAETRPGVLVERKPVGVVLHYRQAPEHEADGIAIAEQAAADAGLEALVGKMIVELRPSGRDKGDAVRLLARAGTTPVFVGDDLTDEAGFRAAAALGGVGVLVGERDGSAAAYALPDVAAVLDWLSERVVQQP